MHERDRDERLRVDGGHPNDWGRTSADYARFRPGFPPSFFERLRRQGIGLRGQLVLDLGTGTGAVALELARAGTRVVGLDLARGQVAQARRLADGLPASFIQAAAEAVPLAAARFDAITASQCWLYFDKSRVVPEVLRLLAPRGRLVTCHLSWLPAESPIAQVSEAIVLRYNPRWTGAGWNGEVPAVPRWLAGEFDVEHWFAYDELVSFTRESWRGRIRACRGVSASLAAEQVAAIDTELAAYLERAAPERFTIVHRIDAHFLRPRKNNP